MKIQTRQPVNRLAADAHTLAADYKARGMDKYLAWDKFIIDRALKPDINAKEFYAIFADAAPRLLESIEVVGFEATHFDTLRQRSVQITELENGCFALLWSDGSTGTNPPMLPPSSERFRVS